MLQIITLKHIKELCIVGGLLCMVSVALVSQKGIQAVSANANTASQTSASTYAVIVGISDYQSPQIPDLQYADKDARAFAEWLRSPGGGKVDAQNITLLTNDSATTASVADGLNWLTDKCRAGDLAIIYFSGHGDVETKIRDQWGFLLCYDSPARNYIAGAYPINYLQSIISTLSLDNKAKVLVITDACHAGKLAGSKINGSSLTNANLAQQFASEFKILSCQVNEFALEGRQWGQGRGVFSWILIDGLNGLADANEDMQVSLMEIGRYLEEKVPAQTYPHVQIPVTVGDRTAVIAKVDENFRNEISKSRSKEVLALEAINMKGMEGGFLSNSDTSLQRKYKKFLTAIEEHKLMSPKGDCANDLYEELIGEKSLEPLHNLLRRNLTVALQDEVQQSLNSILEDDPYEISKWYLHPDEYLNYPIYLERAIQLLGTKHILANSLRSKKLFFEANILMNRKGLGYVQNVYIDSIKSQIRNKISEAIKLEPNAAYLYNAMSFLYSNKVPCQSDSLQYWNQRAMELAPNWLTPILETGFDYWLCSSDACKAGPWIEKGYSERTDSYYANLGMSWLRQWQNRPEESKEICNRLFSMKPNMFDAYATMAVTLAVIDGDYTEALKYARRADSLEKTDTYNNLAILECDIQTGKLDCAKTLVDSMIQRNTDKFEPAANSYLIEILFRKGQHTIGLKKSRELYNQKRGYSTFYQTRAKYWEGKIFLAMDSVVEAKNSFNEIFQMDKTQNGIFIWAWTGLAECNLKEGKIDEAEDYFKKAINYHFCGDGLDAPIPREEAYYLFAKFLMDQNRMDEAKQMLQKSIDERRMGYWGEYGMAVYYALLNDTDQALQYLEKALTNDFPHQDQIQKEISFKQLKNDLKFKQMMNKHYAGNKIR